MILALQEPAWSIDMFVLLQMSSKAAPTAPPADGTNRRRGVDVRQRLTSLPCAPGVAVGHMPWSRPSPFPPTVRHVCGGARNRMPL